jgi:hypothetical protein
MHMFMNQELYPKWSQTTLRTWKATLLQFWLAQKIYVYKIIMNQFEDILSHLSLSTEWNINVTLPGGDSLGKTLSLWNFSPRERWCSWEWSPWDLGITSMGNTTFFSTGSSKHSWGSSPSLGKCCYLLRAILWNQLGLKYNDIPTPKTCPYTCYSRKLFVPI